MTRSPLKCPGVGRDKDCISALEFYFSRPVTDNEMRFLHDVMQRAAACLPITFASRAVLFSEDECPGHVASFDDAKVCARCGTHIDALRPPEDEP